MKRHTLPAGALAAALALFALRQGAPKAAVPGSALRSGACLLHLDPETQTQARLLEGEQDSTPMTVTTREAEWRLDAPDEGQIIMHYLLTLGGAPVSDLHVSLYLTKR